MLGRPQGQVARGKGRPQGTDLWASQGEQAGLASSALGGGQAGVGTAYAREAPWS